MHRAPEIVALSIHDHSGRALWSSSDFLLAEDHALIAEVVEDHRTALARTRGRGDEYVATGRPVCAPKHRYRRWLQVGARDEPVDVPVRCCRPVNGFETGEHIARRGSSQEKTGSAGE